ETLRLYPSEWLAALRMRNWIGSKPDGQGKIWAQPASRESLNDLVDWSVALADDLQVKFLARLGFDALDLTIQRQAGESGSSTLQQLGQQVADLVAAVGSEASAYERLIADARERARRTEKIRRNQILGLHVQRLVEQILRVVGFDSVIV